MTTDAFTDVSRGLIYKPTNYLGLFTVESWREFKRHGEAVMGFTAKKASAAAKLQTGDHIEASIVDARLRFAQGILREQLLERQMR